MISELDEVLRALAHPARRAIISRCTDEWVAAGTLVEELDLAAATVSEHLKVLRKTSVVEMSIDGTWRRYRTLPAAVAHAVEQLDAIIPRTRQEHP